MIERKPRLKNCWRCGNIFKSKKKYKSLCHKCKQNANKRIGRRLKAVWEEKRKLIKDEEKKATVSESDR